MLTAQKKNASGLDAESTDGEVVQCILQGNTSAYAVIISRHNQRLYRVGRAYLRDHDAVEDAMQNAYVKAYQSLAQFRNGSSFATWLTRVMINECLMALRKERSLREDRLDAEKLERVPALSPSGSEASQLSEMKALLEAAIADLPLAYRTVYTLREVEHLTTTETARCLGISLVSAKVKLHRARAMLKERLLTNAGASEVFAYDARYCAAMTARVLQAIA